MAIHVKMKIVQADILLHTN